MAHQPILWNLPSLTSIRFSCRQREPTAEVVLCYLRQFPSQLKILYAKCIHLPSLETFVEFFPTLHTLVLWSYRRPLWALSHSCFPTIQCIGLYILPSIFYDHGDVMSYLQAAFDGLANRAMFPSLSRVWLGSVHVIPESGPVSLWAEKLRSLSIRVDVELA